MNYRRLGSAGLKLSELSLGAWVTYGGQVGEEVAVKCMSRAYDAGVNFFDNAEAYAHGNAETVMGNVIKKLGWRRESIVVSSKVFWGGEGPNDRGLSRKHIFEACRNSLRRLQFDYLDLFFCHRPDPNTPIEETVRAMDDLVHQGKILYWGTSEWSAADIMRAHWIARELGLTPPQMEQPQYNMFHRDRLEMEYLPLYREIGLGTTIWSPLASGLLSGKYNKGTPPGSRATLAGYEWLRESVMTPKNIEKVKQLEPIAKNLDCTMAQLALAWCLKNPNVSTVITGATRPEQVVENMKAPDIVPKLEPEVMEQIEQVLENEPRSNED
ncbi:voltage-dependent potassium channel subunit beta [Candidatus Bathyarchaeota archaeon]|nr:MAG: voltage-dependent potassium channel subunit beta [Candidatus Bathyarchaeota archaeon]TMI30797.1 MAG: voltage-dependent potassium channel subunit beta [Candidatus Bathyarchaeota archaeon]